jgi:hypothetical protein
METRILKSWGEGCARNLAFQLIILVAAFGLFIIPALIAAIWGGESKINISLFMGILVLLIIAIIIAMAIWAVNRLRKRVAYLDGVFEPWGFTGETYQRYGRQYQGEVNGHQVNIYFQRGPTLEIKISAPLHTHAAIFYKSEIGRISTSIEDYETVILNDPTFRNLSIYALDANWMNNLLTDTAFRNSIRHLMRVTGAYELRQILIQPESVSLTIRRISIDEINSENVAVWLEEVNTLVRAIEEAPDPQEITVATPIKLESDPYRRSLLILLSITGCSLITALLAWAGIVAALIFLLSKII